MRSGDERAVAGLEPAGAVEVAAQLVVHLAEVADEAGVGGQGVEPLAAHRPEQADRVVARRVPSVGVDPAEQVAGLLVPRPAQVHGQVLECGQLSGERRPDREATERAHPLDGSHGAIIGRTADRTSLKAEIGAIRRAWRAPSRQFRWGRGINGRWWMTSAPPVGASRCPTTTRSGHRREAPAASVDHVIAALDRGEGRDGPPEGDRPLFLPVGTTALPPNLDGRRCVAARGRHRPRPGPRAAARSAAGPAPARGRRAAHAARPPPPDLLAPRRPARMGLGRSSSTPTGRPRAGATATSPTPRPSAPGRRARAATRCCS